MDVAKRYRVDVEKLQKSVASEIATKRGNNGRPRKENNISA